MDVIEPASSGRAKCRACGEKIARGDLRFGERVPNPFGDGEATYWFHLVCAACRRPEPLGAALKETETAIQDHHRLAELAAEGVEQHRLPRIARAEPDPSGRARCRSCRELIEKGAWRVVLEIWEEGRFGSMGFIHVRCSGEYFGTADVLFRISQATPTLSDEGLSAVDALLRAIAADGGVGASADDQSGPASTTAARKINT
jgi:hypothetical protein